MVTKIATTVNSAQLIVKKELVREWTTELSKMEPNNTDAIIPALRHLVFTYITFYPSKAVHMNTAIRQIVTSIMLNFLFFIIPVDSITEMETKICDNLEYGL